MTVQSRTSENFIVQYDDAATPRLDGDALLRALLATCEGDFSRLIGVFGGVTPKVPITVSVNKGGGGSNDSRNMNCGSGGVGAHGPFDSLRNTFIAELDEIFMAAQGKEWRPGDSKGEALSRALGGAMYPDGQQGGFTVHQWIDNDPDPKIDGEVDTSSGRQDWLSKTFTGNQAAAGDNPAKSTGCGVVFLYYLRNQLGFTWARIVSARDTTFEGVYRQLTGSPGAFAALSTVIATEFPLGLPSDLNGDSTRPFSDSLEQTRTDRKPRPRALWSPNGLTETPLRTAQIASLKKYLNTQGLHGRLGLRQLAIEAAKPMGSPHLSHDSLSTVGLRGLVNSRRATALL